MANRLSAIYIAAILAFASTAAAQDSWHISSRVNGGPKTVTPVVFIRSGDRVSLEVDAMPDKSAGITRVRWREVKPILRSYDNTRGTPEPVEYRSENLDGTGLTLRMLLRHTGTYYFAADFADPGLEKSPFQTGTFRTIEPLQREFSGRVVQIVCRSDDSYLGFLSELAETPFIMGPIVTASGFHQTDQRVGSDCAAFAIYGRRREGFPIPYCGPAGIHKYLKDLAPGSLVAFRDGIYRDRYGNPVMPRGNGPRPGDILHFGLQVSVFYRHFGASPYLTINDLVLESWGSTPHVTSIRDCGFCRYPVRVMRWKSLEN
jgi:hypothetical protein